MAHGLNNNQTQQAYYDGDNFGGYQFISLDEVMDNFSATYVGEGKLLEKTLRSDISFHAHRALQELSYDTLKSCKSQEMLIPASLTMPLPQDYVNYVKLSWIDSSGIEHIIYPTSKTSNPSPNLLQDSDGDFILQAVGTLDSASSSVVLDGEYKDILVGMTVTGPYIPSGTIVSATSNSGGITTIVLSDGTNLLTPTESNTGTTITFTATDGSLLLSQKSSHIVENLDWNNADYKITANAAADITNIKVGMVVSHEYFPVGTVVTNVYTTTIVVDQLPTQAVSSNGGEITFIELDKDTTTWSNYKSTTPSENNNDDYEDDTYWPMDGSRYGLDPQHAQVNGSYYIDCVGGRIHFSSNLSGKTIVLKYISDHMGTHEEMIVPKLAEEAIYKWIAYGCLSARIDVPEYVINRYRKEKFAETRKAKLRLSNVKLEEITQILRGKSKQIKH